MLIDHRRRISKHHAIHLFLSRHWTWKCFFFSSFVFRSICPYTSTRPRQMIPPMYKYRCRIIIYNTKDSLPQANICRWTLSCLPFLDWRFYQLVYWHSLNHKNKDTQTRAQRRTHMHTYHTENVKHTHTNKHTEAHPQKERLPAYTHRSTFMITNPWSYIWRHADVFAHMSRARQKSTLAYINSHTHSKINIHV